MNNAQILILFISSIVFIPFVLEVLLQKLEENAKLAGKKEARIKLEKLQELRFKKSLGV